jgi:hypothetical protein
MSRQQRAAYLLEFIFDGFEVGLVSLDEAAVLICNEAQEGRELEIAEGLCHTCSHKRHNASSLNRPSQL